MAGVKFGVLTLQDKLIESDELYTDFII